MGKRGPAPWVPSASELSVISHYAAIGYTQEQISKLIGKDEKTLRAHAKDALELGKLKADAQITGKLFSKAMSGDTASLIFWCKTRLGWKETAGLDVNTDSGLTVNFQRQADAS